MVYIVCVGQIHAMVEMRVVAMGHHNNQLCHYLLFFASLEDSKNINAVFGQSKNYRSVWNVLGLHNIGIIYV